MDIRGEFWSAFEKSKNQKEVKKKSTIKNFSFNNEPAYYFDIKTNENLDNDIDAQILYQMTKKTQMNSVNESHQYHSQSFDDNEKMRRKWRLDNDKRESNIFTQNNQSSTPNDGFRPDTNSYVDGYVSDYFE
jgi:hypothetical protein